MTRTIGVLTAGSDSPGLNAAIRAIGKAAQAAGVRLVGFQDGFLGLMHDQTVPLEGNRLSGILTTGGTLLGTSRDKPHEVDLDHQSGLDAACATYRKHRLDCLICLGAQETQESAWRLAQSGLNIITLPKAIDNDIAHTDITVGFDTARSIAAEAIDRLHNTAHSHHRIIIVEIMGQSSGWLTLGSGIAGGADVILIPEIAYDVEKIAAAILKRNQAGKRFSIVAVSEGACPKDYAAFFERTRQINAMLRSGEEQSRVAGELEQIEKRFHSNTHLLADRLEKFTGLETRTTILGYLLRGGSPSAADRVLATQLGVACVNFVQAGRFGVMVALQSGQVQAAPLAQVVGQHKCVPLDHPWIDSARQVGTSLGD